MQTAPLLPQGGRLSKFSTVTTQACASPQQREQKGTSPQPVGCRQDRATGIVSALLCSPCAARAGGQLLGFFPADVLIYPLKSICI